MSRADDDESEVETMTLEGCTILGETDYTFYVRYNGHNAYLPKSLIDDPDRMRPGDKGITIVVPAWLAEDRGFDE